ncbi:MAG TPA: CehA/McbA family metallohydrolase [Anaerolineales bacterium]
MPEIILNLHMHTRYSDGTGSHQDIAAAAIRSGLDAVIVTDHNVLVKGTEGYVRQGSRRVLMLVGEEVHDQSRQPQKNHLLALGAAHEIATLAAEPRGLMRAIRDAGGLSFIAHPDDPAAPAFGETDISWVDWQAGEFTGLELWNGLSELKTVLHTKLLGVVYAFFPALVAHAPLPQTLRRWDELLREARVVALGGSDAHALHLRMGPLSGVIFPYEFHFRAINTHLFVPDALTGEVVRDRALIYAALAAGHCFIGYDLPHPTRGFRFTAAGHETSAIMGDEIPCRGGVTLQAHLPTAAEIRLICDGKAIRTVRNSYALTHLTTEPGIYRIEVYRPYLGRKRGWIFSNPIYVR